MTSEQLKQMNELYASIKERLSNPDIDLATRQDIAENVSWCLLHNTEKFL